MSRSLANFISYVFHPGLIPLLGTMSILLLSPHYVSRPLFITVLLYVFFGTYFFPLLMILFLRKLELIQSIHMTDATDRKLPYLAAGLFYFITAQRLQDLPTSPILSKYLYSGLLILGIALLFLQKIKLSIHMAGMGAFLALVMFLSQTFNYQMLVLIALVTLCSGLVGTARLILKAHFPGEIYLGFLLGLITTGVFLWAT